MVKNKSSDNDCHLNDLMDTFFTFSGPLPLCEKGSYHFTAVNVSVCQ